MMKKPTSRGDKRPARPTMRDFTAAKKYEIAAVTIETNLDASSEWDDSQKSRAEELVTVHDTMKLLNDDGSRKVCCLVLFSRSRWTA